LSFGRLHRPAPASLTPFSFSALPGHITTAIQSTIGVGLGLYSIACFLTLPKQFAIVYLGWVYGRPTDPTAHGMSTNTKVSLIVFAVTTLATLIAAYVVWIKARRLRPSILLEMEARRKLDNQEMGEVLPLELQSPSLDLSGPSSVGDASLERARTTVPAGVDAGEDAARPPFAKPYSSSLADSTVSLLSSQYTINQDLGGRSRSSTINTRNRSSTFLSRTPSLPDLAGMSAYFPPVQEHVSSPLIKVRRSSMQM
jgi:hypothetical protein